MDGTNQQGSVGVKHRTVFSISFIMVWNNFEGNRNFKVRYFFSQTSKCSDTNNINSVQHDPKYGRSAKKRKKEKQLFTSSIYSNLHVTWLVFSQLPHLYQLRIVCVGMASFAINQQPLSVIRLGDPRRFVQMVLCKEKSICDLIRCRSPADEIIKWVSA